LLQVTSSIPVVFVQTTDPVGAGYVGSLARPGGNATGFALPEYSSSGKWLEILRQIAPRTRRAVVLRDPTTATGLGQFAAIQSAASFLAIELRPVDIRDAGEIDRALTAFAQAPNGGLVVTNGQYAFIHRELIIALAARHRLPAVYPYRSLVANGGLVSYGTDSIDPYREAARYVDRILKGEKPADLPVQAPSKYELVLNLKTAKALGLTIPETLLATADEVIQ
jgi:putative ABC transport system substrate-binding protein